MKAILAVNNLGYIGLDNRLPWDCPDDFKHFKKMTRGCTLLVGFNTSLTLPKLVGRKIIVDEIGGGDIINLSEIDWCIGGRHTYERYARYFSELHISHINNNNIGDVMFPDFRELPYDCKIFNYHFF